MAKEDLIELEGKVVETLPNTTYLPPYEPATSNAANEEKNYEIIIDGNENLKVGRNEIKVTVEAEDGSKIIYTIYVTKKSNNLYSIDVSFIFSPSTITSFVLSLISSPSIIMLSFSIRFPSLVYLLIFDLTLAINSSGSNGLVI